MNTNTSRWTGLGFLLNYGQTKTAAEQAKSDGFTEQYLAGFEAGLTQNLYPMAKTAASQLGRELMLGFIPKFFLKH